MTLFGCAGLSSLTPTVGLSASTPDMVHQHPADKAGFYSNSYLFENAHDCLLVDVHLNRDEALELSELIARSGKPLSGIVITHPHPDHVLGLEHIGPLHPKAVIFSSARTLEYIQVTAAGWPKFSNPMRALSEGLISLAGRTFDCLLPQDAESEVPVVLFEPESATLIAGDHVLNGQHLWLTEGRPNEWRHNLALISKRWKVDLVLPGHGAIGGRELIDRTDAYLRDFLDLKRRNVAPNQVRQEMLTSYTDHVFPEALSTSILANF